MFIFLQLLYNLLSSLRIHCLICLKWSVILLSKLCVCGKNNKSGPVPSFQAHTISKHLHELQCSFSVQEKKKHTNNLDSILTISLFVGYFRQHRFCGCGPFKISDALSASLNPIHPSPALLVFQWERQELFTLF